MTRRTALGLVVAGAVVVGVVGCSGGSDDKPRDGDVVEESDRSESSSSDSEAVETVAAAVEASTAGRYRFELTVAMGGSTEGEQPLVTGSSDGEQIALRFDGNNPTAQMLLSLAGDTAGWLPTGPDVDRTVDLVLDGDSAYVRAPLLAATPQAPPPPEVTDLAARIGAGWGRVDRSRFEGFLPKPIQDLDPAKGIDASTIEDFLDGLADLEELDPTTVDGEEMSGYSTQASLDQVFELLDLDPAMVPVLGEYVDGPLGAMELPVELWIDGQGYFRRLHVPIAGQFDVTLDLSDFGDESITVDPPTDAVDVTDELTSALLAVVSGV